MYAEGELPADNRDALEDAIKADRLLSLRSMTSYSGRASEVDLFYGEAYSVVRFLLDEFGRDKLHELLGRFCRGNAAGGCSDARVRLWAGRVRGSLANQPRAGACQRSGALRVPRLALGHAWAAS